MDDLEQLKSWTEIVQRHLSVLSKPQAVVLALWSFGIVVTQSCGLTTITIFLALLLGCASRNAEKTTYDESVQHRPPESPKVEADDLEREYRKD